MNRDSTTDLSKSLQLLQSIIDKLPQTIFWKDINSRYLGCDRSFADAAGLESPQDILGKSDYDMPWTKEETDWYRECDRRVIESNTPEYGIIETQVRADGTLAWLETNKVPLHDETGKVMGIVGTFEDITKRKEAEEKIKKSLKNLSDFQYALTRSAIVSIMDAEGVFTYVNARFCTISQYSATELIGNTLMNQPPQLSNKILIVDDVPDNLRLLSTTLTKQGYKVRCAKNAAMALMGARSDLPNLILLDINMPDMNGYQVCQQLKADELTRFIPVIFLSAQDDIEDKVKAFTTGGTDFIGKPFQVEEVLARVKNQLALQAAYAKIHLLNNQLEQRVQERTSQLESANRSLKEEILQRQTIEEKLRYDTLHDSLTDLPNRNLFMELVANCLQQAQKNLNSQFAVLFIDLDRFKVINDSLGHLAGDLLLVACAQRLQKCLTAKTTLARLGGDEFTILIEQIQDVDDAVFIAKKILKEFQTPFAIANRQINITISIGIAIDLGQYSQGIEILRDADTALYQAKELGRARYKIFNHQMYLQALRRLELENELRQAISQQELVLYYQPLFCLTTRQLVGFEALVRWQHPQKGIVSPSEFIPLAEETGLIVPLGNWVMLEACRQLKIWQDRYPTARSLSISINVAGEQLYSPDFLDTIDLTIAQTQVNVNSLKLEITESMLIKNTELVIKVLEQIKQRKIKLCIDDFGTGYSSLSYLPKFPIDVLKIDRSFVSAIDGNQQNFEVIQAIVTLAKAFKMKVIAEGIETEAQLNHLQFLEVPLGQGYLYSKPLTVELAQNMILSIKK